MKILVIVLVILFILGISMYFIRESYSDTKKPTIPMSVLIDTEDNNIIPILNVIKNQEKLPYEVIIYRKEKIDIPNDGLRVRFVSNEKQLFTFYKLIAFNNLEFTDQYINTVNNIETSSAVEVPRIIFIFWTGNNPITQKRKINVEQLKNSVGVPVLMIDVNNLNSFVLAGHPLHEGYQYLSETCKSDYLRSYFTHFYGGGYCDIKASKGSWASGFDEIQGNPDIYLNGSPEIGPGGIPAECGTRVQNLWSNLVSVCSFICRSKTPLSYKLYNEIKSKMDSKLNLLIKYPSKSTIDHTGKILEDGTVSKYPITWGEIMAVIFHPIQADFIPNIRNTLPNLIYQDYR
jgi:hypothetical protein